MSTFKRCISLLLVLGILLGVLAPAAQAAAVEETATVDTGDMTIEGTNGFGTLLSQEIQESQEGSATAEEGYEAGYSVVDLTFDGAVATVEYSSLEEVRLVVAVYSEDGLKMLASGETMVSPEEDVATVTIEGDMPEYFLASAFLVDTYDLSPLCAAYDTPLYTQEMQELLDSTVDDYDPDRVLNLDEDETTNFAVYSETTKIIEYIEGVNTVVSVDDETATYVIEYADEQFTSLAVGDVVAYSYGDNEILIAKIGVINVDGSTVTITGVDLEMEEIFSHVKVESNSVSEDMSVIEGTGEEGITYVGLTEGSDGVTPYAVEGGATVKLKHKFEISKTFSEDHYGGEEGGEVPNTITLAGTLEFGVEFEFDYYASWNRRYVKFVAEAGVDVNIGITGKLNKRVCKLPSFGASPIIGLYIGIKPQFEFQASAELAWEASYSFKLGFSYSNDKGGENLTTPPKFKSEIKLEGTLFFGIDLHPTIEVIGGTVVDVDLTGLVGFEINGKLAGSLVEHDEDDVLHRCELCIQGDIQFKAAGSVKITFLKCKDLTVNLDIFEARFKIYDYYVSLTHGTLGLKTCPYTQYKLIFEVRNGVNLLMSGTEILKKDGTSLGKTNDRGILIVWLPLGKTTVKAAVFDEELQKTIKVTEDDAGSKVVLKFGVSVSAKDYLAGAEDCVDKTTYIASGKCGSNVYWTLSDDGILSIAGKGSMQYFAGGSPWYSYRNSIGSVIIGNGVTTIGGYAFSDCTGLTTVKIPDSVTSIGFQAFSDCTGLTSVEIPDSVTTIGEDAFYNCTDLTTVNIPDSVTTIGQRAFSHCTSLTAVEIPDSITIIDNSTFRYCTNLTSVTIGESVTSIDTYAFDSCTSLTSVTIPDSVTSIGEHAFSDCTGLTSMVIPDSVTTIADGMFWGCTSLTSVKIPGSVITIGEYAFADCGSLKSAKFPDSVTTIGEGAFSNCTGLTSVEIPESVTTIAYATFYGCTSLTSVMIPNSVTTIGGYAFGDCDSLAEITLPDNLSTIAKYAFGYCDSLTSIEIPDSVTTIGGNAFAESYKLEEILFCGNAPAIESTIFGYITATAYYPAGNTTWTSDVMKAFGGYITWVPYTLDENGDMITNNAAVVTVTEELTGIDVPDASDGETVIQTSLEIPNSDFGSRDEPLNPNAVYDGAYSTVDTGTYILKTASFSGLVPGEQYVLLAMVSIDVEDPLAADNLLYIDQAAALEDGTLVFQYVQRTPAETSYVVACGASNKDLNDAEITFPEMVADGETLVVNPTVIYDGKTLTEGQDYTISGTVSVTEPGTYTCYIRGVRNYTGLVECTYTVALVLGVEVASGTCGVNVAWSLYDKGTLLISGTGPMEDYNGAAYTPWYDSRSSILRIIIEEGVTTISEYAFCDCGNMTSMTIPDDVMTIGDCAFSYCEKLTNATIPNSVTSIGEYAFSHCESLTDVSMGNGVISIGYGAFQECSNLASLRIPDSVTSIGKYAFSNCESLTDVSMGNGVSTIGDYAFSGCCDLTSIRLPEGVKSIGRDAFEYCYSLTSVEIPESVTDIGERAFAYCERLTHVEIPHGITAIAEETFSGCHNLTSVTIPDSVTSIGRSAFANCHSLASVKIPNGVTSIGEEAFFYCENMATIIIGHSVATIYSNAFDCCGVKEIRFWGSCPWIYSKAFRGVTATAYYLADDETWADDAVRQGYGGTITWVPYNHEYASVDIAPTCSEQGYTLHTCSVCDYSHMSDFVSALGHSYQDHVCTRCGEHIPEIQLDTESIAVIFNGGGIAYFSFTPDVTAQYTYYSDCNKDTYGYIYDAGLNELAHNDDGDSGTNFAVTQTLEEGVTYILGARFYDSELTGEIPVSIIMGTDVPIKGTCGKNVVWKLRNNGTLTISGSGPMTNYAYYTDVPWYKYLRNIQTVVIEDGVTSIGSYAYYYHTSLTSVTISDSVTSIGQYAFYECESLTNLTMGNSVTVIGDNAFSRCSKLPNVRIPDSVTSIGEYAFYRCESLTDVVMGNSVISIGDSAFMRCSSLTSVRIPDSVTSISRHAFGSCPGLREIYFTGNAPSFGVSVFYEVSATAHYPADNDTWTEDVMQDYGGTITWVAYTSECTDHNYVSAVTKEATLIEDGELTYTCTACGESYTEVIPATLQYEVYGDCVAITGYTGSATEVVIPAEIDGLPVTSIGYGAFRNCCNLISISIPDTVTRIATEAFLNCSSLTSISIPDGVDVIEPETFAGCCSLASIIIPDSVNHIAHAAFRDCTNLTSIDIPDSVTFMDGNIFFNCSSLTSISIPDGVTVISPETFAGCSSLTNIVIPSGVTSMDTHAFSNCSSLSSIYFDGDAPEFGGNVFLNVTATAYYPAYNETWTEAVLQNYGGTITWKVLETDPIDSGFVYQVYEDHVEITDYTGDITEIIIPAEIEGLPVTSIGFYAFMDCSDLTSVTIPNSVTYIGYQAFASCYGLTGITIPDSVTYIGEEAFYACTRLSSISVPASVTYIGEQAFGWIENLTGIHVDENNPNYSSDDRGVLFDKEKTQLILAPCGITDSYIIPDSVTAINNRAFEYCTKLTGITIPAGVKAIYDGTFYDCPSLSTIYFAGDAPIVLESWYLGGLFMRITATAYYPAGNPTWTEEVMQSYGGNITWVAYTSECTDHAYEPAVVEPTCTEQGYTTYTCTKCGDSYIADYVDALGHDFSAWTVIQASTAVREGIEERTCNRCGYAEQKSIPRLENPFADVQSGSYFYDPVMWAVENGITSGISATTFGPDNQCTRGQIVTFLWRAAGSPEPEQMNNPFVDVAPSDYYYKPVLWAYGNGITAGLDESHFAPMVSCTRSQVVTFLYSAFGRPAVAGVENPFSDVPSDAWYAVPILWAAQKGITAGVGNGLFGVDDVCNRAQIVTFLYKAFVND